MEDILYYPSDRSGRLMGNGCNQASKMQHHLYDQMLSQSEFCDVTLVIGEGELKAHWCVLVYCPYFQSLYASGMTEKRSGKFKVNCGKPSAIRLALTFLYTGIAEMSDDNIKDILEVAEYFQITDLKVECAEYLQSVVITSQNCVNLCLLASLYDLDLYHHAFAFLRGHLPEVLEHSDALTLTNDSILSLLDDKTLCYVPQEVFYEFIIKWVENDPVNREHYFPELFCALNLDEIPKHFLDSVINKQALVKNDEKTAVHLLDTEMKYLKGRLTDKGQRDVVLLAGGCSTGPFIKDFIILFPYSDAMSVNNIYGYILQEERWTELAPLPYRMRKPFITFDGEDKIYVFDGSQNKQTDVFYIFTYKISEKRWTNIRVEAPEACTEVMVENIIGCKEELYLVASMRSLGNDMSDSWQTVLLRVDQDSRKSEVKCHLFIRNINSQIVVCTVSDIYICVLGWKVGHSGKGKLKHGRHAARFLFYNVKNGRRIDHSRGAYFEPLMFPVGDQLVVTTFGKHPPRKFNFREKLWKNAKDFFLPNPPEFAGRSDFSYVCNGKEFFLIGGKDFETKKPLESVAKYNFMSREWTVLDSLSEGRMYCGSCIAKMPREHVRCHIKCPHCVYCFRKNQAMYEIDYEEEEDDEDYEDDEEDYDGASDYWDDDDEDGDFGPLDEYWY